jgi:hypothetical protein
MVVAHPPGGWKGPALSAVLDGIQSLRTDKIDRLDLRICQPHQEGH